MLLTLAAVAVARHLGDECPVEIVEDECFDASNSSDHEHDRTPTFIYLSPPARAQLFGVALTTFESMEELILQEIDRLIIRKKSNRAWQLDSSCSDPLILGLCIRRMALQYRHMMSRYKDFRPSK